jgi:hypothetical protein
MNKTVLKKGMDISQTIEELSAIFAKFEKKEKDVFVNVCIKNMDAVEKIRQYQNLLDKKSKAKKNL